MTTICQRDVSNRDLGQTRLSVETHLIARVKWLQRLLVKTSESEISNLDLSSAVDEDVGGLEIAMDDPVVVQVRYAIEELPKEGLEDRDGQDCPSRRVMVDDLLRMRTG